ncbi:polypeptide-interacting protein-binding protein 1 [Triplophysa tibetana]|uniref:Polypeptide-interacting protein-binding protein 1 n=1 Tax=Triplophysa tibetana TaxID=1572043 RepID=A0A5A9PIS9_9TELE|nr:polypeptide-interacting protein-binding protein 1 [Triplophysa tibetana]
MMSDASEMLAAALEQMDGIIAGSKAMGYTNGLFDCQSPTSPFLGSLRVLHLLEDMRAALDLMDPEEKESLRSQVSETTAEGLMEWLQGRITNGHGTAAGDSVYQERLSRLESDKECLMLQVSVLTDQVEVQGEKMRDLDTNLEEHRMKLNATEEILQQELLTRSALETEKLELLTEISSLKLKLAAAEGDRRESTGLYQEVTDMRLALTNMECDRHEYERNLHCTKEELKALQKQLEERDQALSKLQGEAHLETTTTQSQDKTREEDTRGGLYEGITKDAETEVAEDTDEPQLIPCTELLPEADVTTVNAPKPATESMLVPHAQRATESVSQIQQTERPCAASSNEDGASKNGGSPCISPTQSSSGGNDSFGSKRTRSSFGRGFFKMRGHKMTSSAPNLDEGQRKGAEHLDLAGVSPQKTQALDAQSPEGKKKSKGIMKFFGRRKRSQSSSDDLDESPNADFKRGGVRATAGPRLGWSHDLQRRNNNELDSQFSRWNKEQVCEWLQEQGLGLYINQAQQWIRSGETLLKASQHDLEKELGIRHPLHRKKLLLALQALGSEDDALGKLDNNWVTRWLDDIGLPQYKSHFDEGRVDGRMLHYMTVDDLLGLKVGSVLHHLSIKRAIQVLRINRYDPECLRRRPTEINPTPSEICQWTNHRVMEWLRSVDLAEYAPNLRGSGVHGGLMVLESRFNVETIALLLNIPQNKTLLRRHLATHFHLLIGLDSQKQKQQYLENPDYMLLTATAKVKPRRLSFGGFGTLRRKRQEDAEEYICPMNVEMPMSSSFHKDVHRSEDGFDQLQPIEDSEGTVRQIGAFSEGINSLTSMLKEDEFLQGYSSRLSETNAIDDD